MISWWSIGDNVALKSVDGQKNDEHLENEDAEVLQSTNFKV